MSSNDRIIQFPSYRVRRPGKPHWPEGGQEVLDYSQWIQDRISQWDEVIEGLAAHQYLTAEVVAHYRHFLELTEKNWRQMLDGLPGGGGPQDPERGDS